MAQSPGRLYRDYMLDDEDSWTLPRRRAPSLTQSSDRADTPQTIVRASDSPEKGRPMAENLKSRIEYGIARTTEDGIDAVALHPGYGLARPAEESYIDDSSSSTSDGDEPIEPVLEQAQVDPQMANGMSSAAKIALPPDIPKKRRARQPMSPISERSTLTNPSTDTPPTERSDTMLENKMPEFFSRSVFQTALYNPTISHQLLKFGQSRLCGENMIFLSKVHHYQKLMAEVSRTIVEMHDEFISPTAQSQINVPEQVRLKTTQDSKSALSNTIPQLENLFVYAQTDIESLIYSDVYPKFVRHQMTLSAAKALGGDRSRYAGLGDCFVLTDPSKADNPIVYASDGFVKVTGYARNEIIPRNCRFLQGQNTHQASVRRLKKKIDTRSESVELLLNYKKNGEPFWNLLYTSPLFDANGKLVFFLGGQINCSTTVHSSSDVLKILAQSRDVNEDATNGAESPQAAKPLRPKRGFFSSFRNNSSSSHAQQQAPGMENQLLDRIEDMPLKGQINTFYTAYSNYIIVNYSTFLITFVSTGILDLLFPIKAAKAATVTKPGPSNGTVLHSIPAIGVDIFKFLANHGSGSLTWDFKNTVKSGLKAGTAVTLDLKLCAKPYMGFEKFMLHWTPLKDERGGIQWVVLTLGNESRA